MCDDEAFDDMIAYQIRNSELTRRSFAAWTLGAGATSILAAGCKSQERKGETAMPINGATTKLSDLVEAEVDIKTPDGTCDAYFVHGATGSAPGVLIWPDIFGLRPAFRQMGKRLAEAGYTVLVVNPFYRQKKAPTSVPQANMDDPATREALMGMARALTAETAVKDAKAFVAWLDQQPSVKKEKRMGVTGYCMGGPLVLRTAATLPERIGAAATFHGGSLVTDKPDSPHLSIPKMKARFLVAIASNDDAKQPEAKTVLKEAFAKASLPAEVEVYAGTLHGWCPPDSRVYERDAAERAWGRLLVLLREATG